MLVLSSAALCYLQLLHSWQYQSRKLWITPHSIFDGKKANAIIKPHLKTRGKKPEHDRISDDICKEFLRISNDNENHDTKLSPLEDGKLVKLSKISFSKYYLDISSI
jgi:hypothetical protein